MMKRLSLWGLFAAVIMILSGSQLIAEERDVTDYVPKAMKILLKFKATEIQKADLLQDALGQNAVQIAQFKQGIKAFSGLDLDLVEEVWLMIPKEDHGTIVFTGNFDTNAVIATFGNLPNVKQVIKDDTLFVGKFLDDKKGTMQMAAVLDHNTIIIGDLAHTLLVVNSWQGQGVSYKSDSKILKRVRESHQNVVGAFLCPLSEWPGADENIAPYVKGAFFEGGVGEHVTGRLRLNIDNATNAEGVEHIIKGFAILAKNHEKTQGNVALELVLNYLETKRKADMIQLDLKIPGTDIKNILNGVAAGQ